MIDLDKHFLDKFLHTFLLLLLPGLLVLLILMTGTLDMEAEVRPWGHRQLLFLEFADAGHGCLVQVGVTLRILVVLLL